MSTSFELLEKKFAAMGARLKARATSSAPWAMSRNQRDAGSLRLNVLRDNHGEYFDIALDQDFDTDDIEVIDVRPEDRHLLIMVRNQENRLGDRNGRRFGTSPVSAKSKFLCGHDERHWFVAAVPESAASVKDVRSAKEALQPGEVRFLVQRCKVKFADKTKRKNNVFIRQGEWFFVPAPRIKVNLKMIFTNEPLSRGRGSKPHLMEYCYRLGGEAVMVQDREAPSGISMSAYRKLAEKKKSLPGWRQMARNAEVYAKGKISHPDHATIELPVWHRVLMNTENQAAARRSVAFLD